MCAEIYDPNEHPYLHAKVVKHMMHDPCGDENRENACMTENRCKIITQGLFA